MSADLPFTPVVIIGAGRSGTNALRDMLCALPDFATWDCDEINPIWRHGNLGWPNDQFTADMARPAVTRFIRGAFRKIWLQKGKPAFVVEKTCANTLRVPFVNAVLPEAKYIHIQRDGADVVASARKRWQGDLEFPGMPYFLAKARYTPLRDLPVYGWSFLRARVRKAMGQSDRLSIWGPRFDGMETYADADLEELCARQWLACVQSAQDAFAQLDPSRVYQLRYEDFVADPQAALRGILEMLGQQADASDIAAAAGPIRSDSVGKGKARHAELAPHVQALLEAPRHPEPIGD